MGDSATLPLGDEAIVYSAWPRWLVDFEESMIIQKLKEVDGFQRLATWLEFDLLLCSQRANPKF